MSNGTAAFASSGGYIYQAVVALDKIVDLLDNTCQKVNIEKSEVEHIEDIVVEKDNIIEYYQVKYSAVENTKTFNADDFFGKGKDLSILYKTFKGFILEVEKDRNIKIKVYLLTNKLKGKSKPIEGLFNYNNRSLPDNIFIKIKNDLEFNNNNEKNEIKVNISDENINLFLDNFSFVFSYPDMDILENKIKLKLSKIIQTENIQRYFDILYRIVSISSGNANEQERTFTRTKLERILEINNKQKFTHFYNIPDNYINIDENFNKVKLAYKAMSKGIIFFNGKAGSGKTAFITYFLNYLQKEENILIFRYYLYNFDDNSNEDVSDRVKKNYFYYDLSLQLKEYLGEKFDGPKYLNLDSNNYKLFWDNINTLAKNDKILIVIDGIDHAIRAKQSIETFFDTLKSPVEIPNNVILLLSGQPSWDKYPAFLENHKNSEIFKYLEISCFSINDVKLYIEKQNRYSTDILDSLSYKAFNLTNGYPLNLKLFLEYVKQFNNDNVLKKIDELEDNLFSDDLITYYEKIFKSIELNEGDRLRFLSLLALSKEPISCKIVSFIFDKDIFECKPIFKKINPILENIDNNHYKLFHNDIRVYILNSIDDDIRVFILNKLAEYYTDNNELEYSQKNLIRDLFNLGKYEEIRVLFNNDRFKFKNESLRNANEIEDELKFALKSAIHLKDYVFLVKISFLFSKYNTTKFNLENGFDELTFDLKVDNEIKDPYSFKTPKKDNLSKNAIEKRVLFFKNFLKLVEEKDIDNKKIEYFFSKFSIDIYMLKYNRMIESHKNYLYYHFLFELKLDKNFLPKKDLQEEFYFHFNNAFSYYNDFTLKNIIYLKSNDISIPIEFIISDIYHFIEENNALEAKKVIKWLIQEKHITNSILFIILKNEFFELLPNYYNILSPHELNEKSWFTFSVLMGYRDNYDDFLIIRNKKIDHFTLNNYKNITEIGFLVGKSIKNNKIVGFYEIEQLFTVLDFNNYKFNELGEYFDLLIEKLSQKNKLKVLNIFEKYYKDFINNQYDELIIYFIKWIEKYDENRNSNYSLNKFLSILKGNLYNLGFEKRVSRINNIIKIKKKLNLDVDIEYYLLRNATSTLVQRKDEQPYIYSEYFKRLLENNYDKYIKLVFEYIYLEQFRIKENLDKELYLNDVFKNILPIIFKENKNDFFVILNYFLNSILNNEILFSLFWDVLPDEINSQEEALLVYSFYKIASNKSWEKSDQNKLIIIKNSLRKWNIDLVNIFRDNFIDDKSNIYEKNEEKGINNISISEYRKILNEKEVYYLLSSYKEKVVFNNIKKYPKVYLEEISDRIINNELDVTGYGIIEYIVESFYYLKNFNGIDEINNIILTHVKETYKYNIDEEIPKIKLDHENNNFLLIRTLLSLLSNNLFSKNVHLFVSSLESILMILKFYPNEVLLFLLRLNGNNNSKPYRVKIIIDLINKINFDKLSINNKKKLNSELLLLYKNNKYVLIDYTLIKIFNKLNIKLESKKYEYFNEIILKNSIVSYSKYDNSYKSQFNNKVDTQLKSFLNKVNMVLGAKLGLEKFEYFKTKYLFKSIQYLEQKYHTDEFFNKNEFDTNFLKAEFIQSLYNDNIIDLDKRLYLIQIIQSYDLNILEKNDYMPQYILPYPEKFSSDFDLFFENMNINNILNGKNNIISGYWEQNLGLDIIAVTNVNTYLINHDSLNCFKQDYNFSRKYCYNFGVDSDYIFQDYYEYCSYKDCKKDLIPIMLYSANSSIDLNSKFSYTPSNHLKGKYNIIPDKENIFIWKYKDSKIFEFKRWSYVSKAKYLSRNLKFQGLGQIWEANFDKLREIINTNFDFIQVIDVNVSNTRSSNVIYKGTFSKVLKQ